MQKHVDQVRPGKVTLTPEVAPPSASRPAEETLLGTWLFPVVVRRTEVLFTCRAKGIQHGRVAGGSCTPRPSQNRT